VAQEKVVYSRSQALSTAFNLRPRRECPPHEALPVLPQEEGGAALGREAPARDPPAPQGLRPEDGGRHLSRTPSMLLPPSG